MRTHKADLGQIDQAVWNSSHGRFVEQTDNGYIATRMTDHVEPILALISPVFWLWNDVRALLLVQVLFVAAGAWLVYLLSMRQFEKFLTPAAHPHLGDRAAAQPDPPRGPGAGIGLPARAPVAVGRAHRVPRCALGRAVDPVGLLGRGRAPLGTVRGRRAAHRRGQREMALLAAGLGVWALWRAWYDGRTQPTADARRGS
ncbi:MAG: DUF2079 domain-containing protein [Caldilineaceae bacterium]